MLAAGSGFTAGGFDGMLKYVILERLATNPTVGVAGAKVLEAGGSKYVAPILEEGYNVTKAPIISKATTKNKK